MRKYFVIAALLLLVSVAPVNALPPQCLDYGTWQAAMIEGAQVSGAETFKLTQAWTDIAVQGQRCAGGGSTQRIQMICMSSELGRWYYFTDAAPSYVALKSPVGIPIQVTVNGACVKNKATVYLPFTVR